MHAQTRMRACAHGMRQIGAKSVFIATDGTDKEVKQLTSKVKNLVPHLVVP